MTIKSVKELAADKVPALPPRKKAVVAAVMSIFKKAGIEVHLDPRVFEGIVNLFLGPHPKEVKQGQTLKGYETVKLAGLLKDQFTFIGATPGSKGFRTYHFSNKGKSPFKLIGWTGDAEVSIGSPRTFWTPNNADLPEVSVLKLRDKIETITGVKLKAVVSSKTGKVTLRGIINGKNGGNRDTVESTFPQLGKVKSIKSKVGLRKAAYIKEAEAMACVYLVGGPATGRYELWVG
jgi:hypothetical protein